MKVRTISHRLTRMVSWVAPIEHAEQSWSPDGQGMLVADRTGQHCDEVGIATVQDY